MLSALAGLKSAMQGHFIIFCSPENRLRLSASVKIGNQETGCLIVF